ncbi:hypothetical protein TNIN_151201 [Trichonephila inaurata madagascariensis]|uniref:Endonuclease/exonuclease/phosphatase domain-containing protein n=1 Tax=Trichonephila inaurata madagascariensis TaxID=2747483 RepID=A0A8X6I3N7_9ARAC|nr:hypothetical protein TNIN_151201 [Trichonephila inaurata madagascariensis]
MKVKLDQLLELADTHNAQIIAIQETKLEEQMKLNIKEFHIYRVDRPNRGGGGLALLIRDVWSIAKSLSRDRPQVEVCNAILTADGFPPNDERATANILSSHYQK